MPRTPKPQANRSDLLVAGPTGQPPPGMGQPNGQPVRAPTGLPYGENQQLRQAQAVSPLPQQPGPPSTPVPPGQAIQAAKQFQMPQMDVMAPSARPMEPVTAGLPGSPVNAPPPSTGTVSGLLAKMAAATGSGALSSLAQRAQQAGQ